MSAPTEAKGGRREDDVYSDQVAEGTWDHALVARLLGYVRRHRWLFVGSLAVLLGVFAVQLATPALLRAAIDGPMAEGVRLRAEALAAGAEADVSPQLASLLAYALAFLGVIVAGAFLRYLEVGQLARAGQAVIHDLRTELFDHIQRLDVAWFDRRPTGSLVTRVTGDIENLSEMFTSGLVSLFFDLCKIVLIFGVLFWMHTGLALVALALTPLFILTSLAFRGGARRAHRRVRARLSRLNGYLQETLQGIRVVKSFAREDRVSARFAGLLRPYFQANLTTILYFSLFFAVIGLVNTVTQAAMVRVGGGSIADGGLSYGEFIQFWFYLSLLLDPMREIGERYNVLQSALASAERVFDILDTEPRVVAAGEGGAGGRDPGDPAQDAVSPWRDRSPRIAFEGVHFAYAGSGGLPGSEVLGGVSFAIEPGRTVAVVGATGAGKSTLVNLLLRFYDPTAGRVTIDGADLSGVDLGAWRRGLGLVLQEDFVFGGSARENLVLDRPGIGGVELSRALEASAAAPVVERLEAGLDTELGERGSRLSTGERELFAIARALAGDPHLVILDEATSSVDSATEARIEAATRALLEGRSAFVVAHRLSTVRRADTILVLHKGHLVESGTHDELLRADGAYARLHRLQFQDA